MGTTNLELTLAVIAVVCYVKGHAAIIGGIPDENRSTKIYPFFVTIHVGETLCGGTVIRADAIVTSAECLYDVRRKDYVKPEEVAIYKQNHEGAPTRFHCERFVPHSMFAWDRKTFEKWALYDIAVIKLRECIDYKVNKVFPLRPCASGVDYPNGFAVGLGGPKDEQKQGRRKKKNFASRVQTEVLLRKDDQCGTFLQETGIQLHQRSQLCFLSNASGILAGTSKGDYGGPIVHQDRFVICLIGVASFSLFTRNQSSIISVFTSATHNSVFIEHALESRLFQTGCEIL